MVGTFERHPTLTHAIGARRRAEAPDLELWKGVNKGVMRHGEHLTPEGRTRWLAANLKVAYRLTEGGMPKDQQFDWSKVDA